MRTKVDIFFDNNPNKVFYGGQVLRGRVILSLPRDSTLKSKYLNRELLVSLFLIRFIPFHFILQNRKKKSIFWKLLTKTNFNLNKLLFFIFEFCSKQKGIYVTIEGKALCQFGTMAHKHYHHQHETTFSGEEYYLSERINLVGDRDSSWNDKFFIDLFFFIFFFKICSEELLFLVQFSVQGYFPFVCFISAEVFFCADIYTYTFECQLPEGLPTSLEGDFGFIRYSATVVLEYPMNPPKVFVQYISVLKKLDLNLDPFMRVSLIKKNIKIQNRPIHKMTIEIFWLFS